MFYFIPDSSMVGTVFVNSIANAYSSITNNTKLEVNLRSPSGTLPTLDRYYNYLNYSLFFIYLFNNTDSGPLPAKALANGTYKVEAGTLQIGQTRDYIFTTNPTVPKLGYDVNYQYRLLQAPEYSNVHVPNSEVSPF